MNTKNGGDRKRTITVTLGPKAEAALDKVQKQIEKAAGIPVPPTAILAMLACDGLNDRIQKYQLHLAELTTLLE